MLVDEVVVNGFFGDKFCRQQICLAILGGVGK